MELVKIRIRRREEKKKTNGKHPKMFLVVEYVIAHRQSGRTLISIHPNNEREFSVCATMSIADLVLFLIHLDRIFYVCMCFDPYLRDKFQINGSDSNS